MGIGLLLKFTGLLRVEEEARFAPLFLVNYVAVDELFDSTKHSICVGW